jgi:invasion protein IalB
MVETASEKTEGHRSDTAVIVPFGLALTKGLKVKKV